MLRRLILAVALLLPCWLQAQVPQAVKALENIKAQPSSGPTSWTNGAYQYDGAGNIKAIGSEAYVYDKISRLKNATLRGPDLSSMQTQSFDYDAYGNLIGTAKLGQTVALPITGTTNRLSALRYDAAGNVIMAGTQQYDYDAVGMVNAVRVGTGTQPRIIYAYTADDERLFAFDVQANTTRWTLRGFNNKVLRVFKQTGGAWSVERDYVYRDGLLLAALKSGGAVEHYSLDHLGTPRLVTDGAGNKIGYHVYWPFGGEWSPGTAQEDSPLKFTGHERDADPSGGNAPLDYMHARYYSPLEGRFLSVDPEMDVEKIEGQPQAWNRYAYVVNNPINRTDPNGRCFWDVCAGEALIGAAILTATAAYVVAPSAVVPGKTNGQVLVDTAVGGFQALGRAVGSLLPGRQATTGVDNTTPVQSQGSKTSPGFVVTPGHSHSHSTRSDWPCSCNE